ncbi:hypothetical protein D5047_16435 [Verminephrobacter eiseniae]|nr:hypothetical protein [Verminephrobacter eiseniae]
MMAAKPAPASGQALAVEGRLPSLSGAVEWLNSPPLTAEGLRGKERWRMAGRFAFASMASHPCLTIAPTSMTKATARSADRGRTS